MCIRDRIVEVDGRPSLQTEVVTGSQHVADIAAKRTADNVRQVHAQNISAAAEM